MSVVLNMHANAIQRATQSIIGTPIAGGSPVQVLMLSKDSELRGKWYKLSEELTDRTVDLSQQRVEVIHLNANQLTSAIARGATRSAIVLSRRLWGRDSSISAPRWLELHNSLTTCAHAHGCEVSDLIYYI